SETLESHRASTYTGSDRAEVIRLIESIRHSGEGMTSQLPIDLFAPSEGLRKQEEQLTLPWGEAGWVRTSFSPVTDPRTGLMRQARREVLTDIAGDRRRTVENWELRPARH